MDSVQQSIKYYRQFLCSSVGNECLVNWHCRKYILWVKAVSVSDFYLQQVEGIHLLILPTLVPAKNRNLNRLISNLSRLNWSSERNSVYCFSTVFTLTQYQGMPSTCLPRNLPCLVLSPAPAMRFWPTLDCGTLDSNTLLDFFRIAPFWIFDFHSVLSIPL